MQFGDSPRVLLDTNVWSYASAVRAQERLAEVATQTGAALLMPPSVVDEALRLADPLARRALIDVLTSSRWVRLLPEAHAEAMEFLELLMSRRPEWLWPRSRTDLYDAAVQAFEGQDGFWRFVRRFPAAAAQASAARERRSLAKERAWAAEDRQRMSDEQFGSLDVSVRGRLGADLPGYDGDEVEPWRGQAMVRLWSGTSERSSDPEYHRTWLEPFVNIDSMRLEEASFVRLFLYEAHPSSLPRAWTRWAVRLAQATRRTTGGTPGDNLLSVWWSDAQLFITADKALADIAAKVRAISPVDLAKPVVVPAGEQAATAACSAIQAFMA